MQVASINIRKRIAQDPLELYLRRTNTKFAIFVTFVLCAERHALLMTLICSRTSTRLVTADFTCVKNTRELESQIWRTADSRNMNLFKSSNLQLCILAAANLGASDSGIPNLTYTHTIHVHVNFQHPTIDGSRPMYKHHN